MADPLKDFNPNELAETIRKTSELINGDFIGRIKELSGLEETILNSQNTVVREFDFQIGKHQVKGQVRKNGNVTLLSQSNGVVEEIIKRLCYDRHSQ